MDTPAFLASDTALVRQALSGRESAFETLVWRYQRRAFAIAHAIGVHPSNLEDVVQESFLHAARSLSALRDPGAFGSWFLAIVRNLARRELRGNGLPRATAGVELDSLPSPEPPAPGAHALRAELEREVGRLPETLREAILLYYYEGRSTRRVARALGITPAAARSRLKRGRDLLQKRLWRKLGDSIRERFPSTRTWRRTAGRLALLAAVSSGAPSSSSAMAGSGAAPTSGMVAFWIGGLLAVAKSSVFLWSGAAVAALLLAAVTAIYSPSTWRDSPRAGSPTALVAASARESIAPAPPRETRATAPQPQAARDESQPVEPPPDPGPSVSGIVIDRSTRLPVPGARVRLWPALSEGLNYPPQQPHDDVRTEEDGNFLVHSADLRQKVAVEVTSESHARLYRFVQFATGEPVEGLVIELEPGYTVRGSVRAAAELAGDTAVRIECVRDSRMGSRPPLGIPPDERMNSRRQAIALRERSFHFENLPADKYFVNTKVADPRFSRDSWTEVDVGEDHPTAEVEIVLEEGRTIRGQAVWDDGSPIRKAYIALVAAWPAGTSVDASDDGTFEIAGLRRDLDYSLEVQKQGVKQVFPLIADMDTYVVDGKPMFRIRMRHGNHVFGEDEAFFISWTQFDDPSSPTIKHHFGGEVAEISVPRGSFRKAFVWCSKGMGRSEVSFAPVVVDLTAVTGPDLYIDVEEGAVMKGRVVTEDGKALRGMEVRVAANLLGPETRKLTWSYCVTKASTDEHGEFAVMGLPLDPRLISVSVAETEGWKQAEPLEVESYGAPVTIVMTR